MYRVLIADDEPKVIKLIRALINWDELKLELVATAQNGIEALELIELQRPDIVITDIRMPGYDGIEMIKNASQRHPKIDFIIVSGYQHFDYAHNAIKYGVKDYLLKPLDKEEINQTLAKILSKYSEGISADPSKSVNHQEMVENSKKTLLKKIVNADKNLDLSDVSAINSFYHTKFRHGIYQALVIKPDIEIDGRGTELLDMLMRKIEAISHQCFEELCYEYLIYSLEDKLFIVLNYEDVEKRNVRKAFQRIIDESHSLRDLFGNLTVTVADGGMEESFFEVHNIIIKAANSIYDRIDRGCGSILSGTGTENEGLVEAITFDKRRKLTNVMESLELSNIMDSIVAIIDDLNRLAPRDFVRGCFELLELVNYTLRRHVNLNDQLPENLYLILNMATSREAVIRITIENTKRFIEKAIEIKKYEVNKPIRDAQKFIQENYASTINLDDISNLVGFSSAYFSTLFKKETGYNFLEYVTIVRINIAKQMLIESQIGILDIAYEVGYSDHKHFTKQFKKLTGLTPSQYRKLYY